MNRRAYLVVVIVLLLGAVRLAGHLGRDPAARSSDALRQLALSVAAPPAACFEAWRAAGPASLEGCPADPAQCERFAALVRCARSDRGLPDGLAAGTLGAFDYSAGESWLRAALEGVQAQRPGRAAFCADLFAFAELLARRGGQQGERFASRLSLLALQPCAALEASPEERRQAAAALTQVEGSRPGELVNALSAEVQLKRLGSWLRPDDLAALGPGMRALAATAPPPPQGFGEKRTRARLWATAQQAAQALAQGPLLDLAAREQALRELEAAWPKVVAEPGLFRTALEEEQARLDARGLLLAAWTREPGCEGTQRSGAKASAEDGRCVLEWPRGLKVSLPLERN